MGWPRAPKWLSVLVPPLLSLNAIPFFLLGLILIFLFSFRLKWFPLFGGYQVGTFPSASWSFKYQMSGAAARKMPPFQQIAAVGHENSSAKMELVS